MSAGAQPWRLFRSFGKGRGGVGSWRLLCFSLALMLSAVAIATAPAQSDPQPSVQVSLAADSSDLTVGDLVTLSLIVSYPEDSTAVVPRLEREWGPFDVQAQTSVQTVSLADGIRTVAKQFRVTLFTPGTFETPDLPVSIRGPDGTVAWVSPIPVQLTVDSVLSSPDEELKDLRPPADLSTPLWERPIVLMLVALAIVVIGGGVGFYFHRRSRRGDGPLEPVQETRTPWEMATQELDRIARLDLLVRGNLKEHYTLVSNVLRLYLRATYLRESGGANSTDMSTEEISAAIWQTPLEYRRAGLVIELLQEADLVKFANYTPTTVRAHEVTTLVRDLVELTAPLFSETPSAGTPARLGAAP